MRLRLFDRIRRLVHFRRSPAETAGVSGAQGRHRRDRRRGPATAPGSQSFPAGRARQAARTRLAAMPRSAEWSSPGGRPRAGAYRLALARRFTDIRSTGRAR